MRRKRTQSAYVRRKNAKKACVHCGSHDVRAYVDNMGAYFVCRASWDNPFETWQRGAHSPYDDPYRMGGRGA